MQDPALSAPLCWEPALGQHCVRQLKFLLCTFAVAGLDKNTSLKCEGCQVWIVALFFFFWFVCLFFLKHGLKQDFCMSNW